MWKMCALSKEKATWCVRWRQHTPSCELSLEVLICWGLAAQRSSVDWTGYSSASHGWASLGTSSVDPCSCAVCTSQSHSPATVKHRTSQSVLRHKLTCMLSTLKFFFFLNWYKPVYFLPRFSLQRPHSHLRHCCRSYKHRNQDKKNNQ